MADSGICHICRAEETLTNKLIQQQCGIHEVCDNCFSSGIDCCSVSSVAKY